MIYEKLQKARIELQNKKLKKSGENGYSHFKYYELADFLPQINQIFLDLKLCSNFSIKDGVASLTVTDWEDNTKEVFTSPIEDLELKGCSKIQALGGVHTYMKRYLYLNALEIVESDMLDAQAGNIEEVKKKFDDTDIYVEFCNMTTESDIWAYYKKYKDKVNEPKRLYAQAQNQLKTVKKAAATRPDEIPF